MEQNKITKIEINLGDDDRYRISVTKRFAPEYGGGESTFQIGQPFANLHMAVDEAKQVVTFNPSHKTDFEAGRGMG